MNQYETRQLMDTLDRMAKALDDQTRLLRRMAEDLARATMPKPTPRPRRTAKAKEAAAADD